MSNVTLIITQVAARELAEARESGEAQLRARANGERVAKQLEQQLGELGGKWEEAGRQIAQLNSQRSKFQAEVCGVGLGLGTFRGVWGTETVMRHEEENK